jgi:hypothetical protein
LYATLRKRFDGTLWQQQQGTRPQVSRCCVHNCFHPIPQGAADPLISHFHFTADCLRRLAPPSSAQLKHKKNELPLSSSAYPAPSQIKSPRTSLPYLPPDLTQPLAATSRDSFTHSKRIFPRISASAVASEVLEAAVSVKATAATAFPRLADDQVLLDLDDMRCNPP